MLGDEDEIKGDRNVGKSKFQGIAGDATPIPLEAGIDDELQQREDATDDVKEDLGDAPPLG